MIRRWDLDRHRNGRTGLEEANRCVSGRGRLVGIEPEIIERAPANCVRVAVLRERFAGPRHRIGRLSSCPPRAAEALVVAGPIVSECWTLRRSMKTDIAKGNASPQRNAEHLDRAVKVFVINGILVMVNASRWIAHLVPKEADAVMAGIRLKRIQACAIPSKDSGPLPHRGRRT